MIKVKANEKAIGYKRLAVIKKILVSCSFLIKMKTSGHVLWGLYEHIHCLKKANYGIIIMLS